MKLDGEESIFVPHNTILETSCQKAILNTKRQLSDCHLLVHDAVYYDKRLSVSWKHLLLSFHSTLQNAKESSFEMWQTKLHGATLNNVINLTHDAIRTYFRNFPFSCQKTFPDIHTKLNTSWDNVIIPERLRWITESLSEYSHKEECFEWIHGLKLDMMNRIHIPKELSN